MEVFVHQVVVFVALDIVVKLVNFSILKHFVTIFNVKTVVVVILLKRILPSVGVLEVTMDTIVNYPMVRFK
jgi:hypothetical protein